MVKKEYSYSKLVKKIFGIILIALFIFLAFKSIDKFRNFFGIFLSINCIIMANTLTKVFLPNKIKNDK